MKYKILWVYALYSSSAKSIFEAVFEVFFSLTPTSPYVNENVKQPIFEVIFKVEVECFITGSKHIETDENRMPKINCFYRFEVFGTRDEAQSPSFLTCQL